MLRLHSSLRSVPLLLGHFRADGDKAREEEEGMARETRALPGRWQQFGRGGPAFAEILRKNVFRVSLGDRLRKWGCSTLEGRSVEGPVEMQPFQIIFNPTSAAELSKLPKDLQLQVLGQFRGLPSELMREEGAFGSLSRQGRTLTRYRLGDYRVYFERHPLGVVVHRILSRNTLKDFLYRSSLPTGEDEQLEGNPKFWELIAAAKSVR